MRRCTSVRHHVAASSSGRFLARCRMLLDTLLVVLAATVPSSSAIGLGTTGEFNTSFIPDGGLKSVLLTFDSCRRSIWSS